MLNQSLASLCNLLMGVERGEKEGLAGPPVELEMSNLFILSKHDCNFITFSLCIVQISHMV